MWIFHLASLDKVTPKCLWFVVIGILFPLIEKIKLYPTSVLENTIMSVLIGLKDINHFVLIKWFENYLHQRKQKVINRATSSTVCEVSAGVLQRSV
jgi:hypothetical protein